MSRPAIAIRVVYLVLCLAALAVGLSAFGVSDMEHSNERRLGGHLLTTMFGFPTAFFGAGLVSDIARHFGIQTFSVSADPLRYVGDWLIEVALGYVQWFAIFPTVWRMIRFAKQRAKTEKAKS